MGSLSPSLFVQLIAGALEAGGQGISIAGDFLSPSLISRLIAFRSFDPTLQILPCMPHSKCDS